MAPQGSLDSSDLLAKSISDSTSSPLKRPYNTPRKTRQNNIQLQDYYLTTPPAKPSTRQSPSVARQTENLVSPWRIRVRVEAERDDGVTSPKKSPKKMLEQTTTTVIPLKGADEPRKRGRPRKSDVEKRVGTPKPKQVEEPTPKRGRPRKNPPTETPTSGRKRGRPRKDSLVEKIPLTEKTPASGRKRGRPAKTPVEIAVDDTDAEDIGDEPILHTEAQVQIPLSEISSMSPQKGIARSLVDKSSQKSSGSDVPTSTRMEQDDQDPNTLHSEFDSVLEAEDMTMITLNSIPSAQGILQSRDASRIQGSQMGNTPGPQSTPARWGNSLLNLFKQATPSQIFSSPMLPPIQAPPKRSGELKEGPKLAKVVQAGIALQGVTKSPDDTSSRNRLDNLFSGFGVNTQRELKAGLRLGEELVKRQANQSHGHQGPSQPHARPVSKQGDNGDDVFQELAMDEEQSLNRFRASLERSRNNAVQYPIVTSKETEVESRAATVAKSPKPAVQDGSGGSDGSETESGKVPGSEPEKEAGKQSVEYPDLTTSVQQLPSPENSLTQDEDEMDWQQDAMSNVPDATSKSKQPHQPSPESLRATTEPITSQPSLGLSSAGTTSTSNQQSPEKVDAMDVWEMEALESSEIMTQKKKVTFEEREQQYQRERVAISKQIEEADSSQVVTINSDDPTPSQLYPDYDAETPTTKKRRFEEEERWREENLCPTLEVTPRKIPTSPPPFSIYKPWNYTHYKVLNKLYLKEAQAEIHGKLTDDSPLHQYLESDVGSMGWVKPIEEWELVVVNRFMEALRTKGVAERGIAFDTRSSGRPATEAGAKVDPQEVVVRCFSLWVGRIQRGLEDLDDGQEMGYWDSRWVGNRKDVVRRSRLKRRGQVTGTKDTKRRKAA